MSRETVPNGQRTTVASEYTVRVKGAEIFVTDTGGDGPPVV